MGGATVGLLSLPGCGKDSFIGIGHSKFSVAPEEHFVQAPDRSYARETFMAYVIAEHVSHHQSGEEHCRFFTSLWDDCRRVGVAHDRSYQFKRPLLINTDCAGGLHNGILKSMPCPGKVTNRIMWSNVVLFSNMLW